MWLTYPEALTQIGVARSTMLRWRNEGRGPIFKRLPNGSLIIHRDKLTEWFDGLPEAA
jgi:predicted site-specific integrase-resolvase